MEKGAMSTPAAPTGGPGTDADTAPAASPKDDGSRSLVRALWILGIVTVVLLAVFAVVYYLGQRTAAGPALTERAVTAAEEAVKTDPNNVGARMALASAYAAEGMSDEALAQYQEIIKVEPEHRPALLGAASLLYRKDDLGGAKTLYQRVIDASGGQEFSAVDPALEEAYYYLGAIDVALNDIPAAIVSLEAALKIDPTDADAWYTLGNAQIRNAKYEKSAAAYQKALAFVPSGWCEPYDGLGIAYTRLNRPDGVTFAKAMGEICRGDMGSGVTDLQTVTAGEFKVPALLGLGQAAEANEDVPKAIDYYRQIRVLDPTNIAALTALARLGDAESTPAPSATPETSASSS
jgi:superkiller protein 3